LAHGFTAEAKPAVEAALTSTAGEVTTASGESLTAHESQASHARWGAWLSSAAAVLVAFGLGRGLGLTSHTTSMSVVPGGDRLAGGASSRDAVTLMVRDAQGNP